MVMMMMAHSEQKWSHSSVCNWTHKRGKFFDSQTPFWTQLTTQLNWIEHNYFYSGWIQRMTCCLPKILNLSLVKPIKKSREKHMDLPRCKQISSTSCNAPKLIWCVLKPMCYCQLDVPRTKSSDWIIICCPMITHTFKCTTFPSASCVFRHLFIKYDW